MTDGSLDNAHMNAIDVLDEQRAVLTWDLRNALTAQIPYTDGGYWPPPETSINVALEANEWRDVVALLDEQIAISQTVDDHESVTELRAHIATIERAL